MALEPNILGVVVTLSLFHVGIGTKLRMDQESQVPRLPEDDELMTGGPLCGIHDGSR